MNLPEIPDEAAEEVHQQMHQPTFLCADPSCLGLALARAYVTAAWPHLYAAALDHAADQFHPGADIEVSELRRMADEATA